MEIYKIKNLNFSYPNSNFKTLDNINLTINSGDFVTVCGVSGCGKTTLLRQLKTAISPHGTKSGNIFFMEKPLAESSEREQSEKIGFVGQSPDNQIVTDKVWHELAFGLESLGCDKETIRRRTAEMASFFGIEAWFEKSVSELSGGQKQLLNLASVMVMQPSVLILDEPTSQLDPIAATEFLGVIQRINHELGTTIIITEHRLDEIFTMCNRVLVMSNGKIISDNTAKKTGDFLKSQKSGMFLAMPVPMRIWSAVSSEKSECPLTISEGRKWLENYALVNGVKDTTFTVNKRFEGKPIINAGNLWFRYEKNSADILKGVCLEIYSGEFLAIMGGNGAGKSTLLSVLSGIKTPYRGQVKINGIDIQKTDNLYNGLLGVLPQNPQTLFTKTTVIDEMYDMISNDISDEERDKSVLEILHLCKLNGLENNHPYDLSGGEQQRTALAKILLKKPKILLLDEPTKGLDAEFKQIFAGIIKNLCDIGICVIMVSHDIEFCAEHSDRCAMFFNGQITAENSPAEFFGGNSFYTTSANRMSRTVINNAITSNDVISACGGEAFELEKDNDNINLDFLKNDTQHIKESSKKMSIWRKILAVISFIISVVISVDALGIVKIFNKDTAPTEQKYLLLGLSAIVFMFSIRNKPDKEDISLYNKSNRKLKKRTKVAAAMIFLAIPFTIYIGVFYLGDKKYLFISLLVMFECMLPFFMIFEDRKPQAKELVIISVLCALAIAGRAALYMFPNFKPVMAVVIISGIALGAETGFLVGAITMLVSNMMFQQGPWTPWQMFAMGIIGFLSGIIFRKGLLSKDKITISVFGFLSALLIYGGIMNPSALIMSHTQLNKSTLLASYVTGFPVDIVHAIATMLFLYVGAQPMLRKLERVKIKYGLVE